MTCLKNAKEIHEGLNARGPQAKAGALRQVCRTAFLPVPFSFASFSFGEAKEKRLDAQKRFHTAFFIKYDTRFAILDEANNVIINNLMDYLTKHFTWKNSEMKRFTCKAMRMLILRSYVSR
jgi:hypothetical protein